MDAIEFLLKYIGRVTHISIGFYPQYRRKNYRYDRRIVKLQAQNNNYRSSVIESWGKETMFNVFGSFSILACSFLPRSIEYCKEWNDTKLCTPKLDITSDIFEGEIKTAGPNVSRRACVFNIRFSIPFVAATVSRWSRFLLDTAVSAVSRH